MKVRWQARHFGVAVFCIILLRMVVPTASAQDGRKVLVHPEPAYPEFAKSYRLTGIVKVDVVIGRDGQIKDTKVIGGPPIFVTPTLEALKQWRYTPADVETTAHLTFNFKP